MEPRSPGDARPQPVHAGLGDVLQEKCDQLREQQRLLTLIESSGVDPEPPPLFHEIVGSALPVEVAQGAEIAYAARLLAQLYLPYRDPGPLPRWVRVNGAVTLIIQPGEWIDPRSGEERDGYPYGSLPRLLLTWMTGEALRTTKPVLEVGHSLYEFLGIIGLNPPQSDGRRWRVGGIHGQRLVEQMHRLFNASFKVRDERDSTWALSGRFFITEFDKMPRQPGNAWGATITLSDRFFQAIMEGSVPLDAQALRALRGSPLRLDIYTWLAHRLGYLKKPTAPIPWDVLARQFGGDYKQVRQFKAQFIRQLATVRRDAYPTAKVDVTDRGLILRPSKPAVPGRR